MRCVYCVINLEEPNRFEINASPETEVDEFHHHVENVSYRVRYDTLPPLLFLCFTTHITFSADHGGRWLQPIPSPVAR